MRKGGGAIFIIVLIVLAAAVLVGVRIFSFPENKASPEVVAFAKCLAQKGITMYGAEWCSHCQEEEALFADAFKLVPYIDCPKQPKECLALGINNYPTWLFPDGKKIEGFMSLEKLAEESGCVFEETKTP